jgi:DNA-binding LytR/AlgR family response regulator
MRIGLCEDDKTQLAYVNTLINKWAEVKKIQLYTFLYESAEQLLFEHTDCFPFDLLILDIQMDKINGMELARKIRLLDKYIPILFLTGQAEYVYEGYEVGAFRFLLKPIKEEQLKSALDQIYEKHNKEADKYYIFQYLGEIIKLVYKDIIYVESFGHYVRLITVNSVYEWKYSLGKIMKELDDLQFCSPHRSYLVNLLYVETIGKAECVLSTGNHIPISRNNYQNFHLAFIGYYKGSLANGD